MIKKLWQDWFRKKKGLRIVSGRSNLAISQLLDFLIRSIPDREKAALFLKEVAKFRALPSQEQESRLANMYLSAEYFLITYQADFHLNAHQFRAETKEKFPDLFASFPLTLVTSSTEEQGFYVIREYLLLQIEKLSIILGQVEDGYLPTTREWLSISEFPEEGGLNFPISSRRWSRVADWQETFISFSNRLNQLAESHLGDKRTRQLVTSTFNDIAQRYQNLEGFTQLVSVIPARYLTEETIKSLKDLELQRALLKQLSRLQPSQGIRTA